MKKLLAAILCCAMSLSVVGCADNSSSTAETTESQETTQAVVETLSDDQKERIELKLGNFEGIVYITHNGSPVYSYTNGKDEKGGELTVETPMYIGSVSKQFCATAIMILKEQGKLSVDDKLEKYFPEYTIGKDVTIKNLLTMRSGVPEMIGTASGYSADKTESENVDIIKKCIFEQPLDFEPDTEQEYSNTNYFLLGNIVEEVSGQSYNDFVRENIFKPLTMDNTGFVNEVKDNEFFSKSLTYDTFSAGEDADGLTKGAGDVVTTAIDMDKWMTGLTSNKVVTEETYKEMTTNYSPDCGNSYCYGLSEMPKDGYGHVGGIGAYVSVNYFNKEQGYNLYAVSTEDQEKVTSLPSELCYILISE